MAIPKHRDNLFEKRDESKIAQQVEPVLNFDLHRPDQLSPSELDGYLESGWYRQGQGLFSTYSTISRKIMMAAPWIRIESDKYSLGKSLRRLKSRNDRRLTYHIGKAVVTPYREEMFQQFRVFFKGEFYESLQSALFCYQQKNKETIFDSMEITFYYEGKLIGYSYFDVGENSVASILNIYDFYHTRFSLGMYAILLQLEWCQQNGIKYYYPGYAMPENPRFDYKLRIKGVDYLDQTSGLWQPWANFSLNDSPLYEYRNAMVDAHKKLAAFELGWRIGVYLNHSNPCPKLIDEEGAEFLSHPIFLSGDITEDFTPVILDYDLVTKQYRLYRCTQHPRPPYPDDHIELDLSLIHI